MGKLQESCKIRNLHFHQYLLGPPVPKTFGSWVNEGACIGDSLHPNCGPGNQIQVRTCTDGSNASRFPVERCTVEDKRRTVSCAISGTELPNCITEGILNEILNYLIQHRI